MLNNGNNDVTYNDFSLQPKIPYKILEYLLKNSSAEAEKFWKCLKYATVDALDNENLTYNQKKELVWTGQSEEQNYNVFLKPLISDSLDSATSQQQLRIYRYHTEPTSKNVAIITLGFDFITNEKTSIVYDDGILCERTDLIESLFLQIFNGRDINIGSGYLSFDKDLTRSCGSTANISNAKSFFGRSLIMGLRYVNIANGGCS